MNNELHKIRDFCQAAQFIPVQETAYHFQCTKTAKLYKSTNPQSNLIERALALWGRNCSTFGRACITRLRLWENTVFKRTGSSHSPILAAMVDK